MSEIQESGGSGKKGGKVRSKKASTHIDMTPMVDLAFLLLTFFLLTTTFNKPKTMELVMPEKNENKEVEPPDIPESAALTLLLSENNRIFYYHGIKDPKVEVTNYSREGIRKILLQKKATVEAIGNPNWKMTVLIKPDDKATYRNMVDILDEMNIVSVPIYALVDITPKEVELIDNTVKNAQQ